MLQPEHVEMRQLRHRDMNMRLIINHAHRHMRVMDFRVGNYEDKREELDQLAHEDGLRKAFILVEKQDSHNWRGVGFVREGIYPAFFRTADAYVMSRLYDVGGTPLQDVSPLKPNAEEKIAFPARKLRKPDGLRVERLSEARLKSLIDGLNGELRALPFGRADVPDLVLHAKARKREVWAMAEIDDSFGHATVGVAPAPSSDSELVLAAFACNRLIEDLDRRNVTNLFGLSPANDGFNNELYAGLGFRVTGRLASHLRVNGDNTTALIWHRRLSQPKS
jgi:hypothetical protein